ncbi:uncharacterized protein LOC129802539 isoform X2 [Phlebotomus papatasi]|uniref:uncharacterized protein LOC129802539 isoform X2 n=1 Tax=Phlebotomus papatasi TaxID=29031 RepID=UPI002484225A|nr:uncharacterized protein LOC129802539 isoform X2 [Phlebotomus papatasi]
MSEEVGENSGSVENTETENLFSEWKISEDGKVRLRHCGVINLAHLASMTAESISKIFADDCFIGDSIIFRQNLKNWQKENKEKLPANDDEGEEVMDVGMSLRKPQSLENLLQESFLGRAILDKGKKNRSLSNRERNILVTIIIEDNLKHELHMSPKDFTTHAEAILRLFPSENPLMYYKPRLRKSEKKDDQTTQKNPSGKLFNKYKNLKRKYSVKKTSDSTSSDAMEVSQVSETGDENASNILMEQIQWLKENKEPWLEVLEKWQATSEWRLREQSVFSSQYFLDICPGLKDERGFELIDIDFFQKFPQLQQKSMESFKDLQKKLSPIFSIEIKDKYNKSLFNKLSGCNEDSQLYITSMLINAIIPPGNMRGNKKVSISTAQHDMIVRLDVSAQIDSTVKDCQKEAASKGSPQMKIIVTGELEELKESYVCCGEFLFKLPSFAKALEVYMKMSIFFGIEYSRKCKYAWELLEGFYFEFMPSRSYDPKVENILKQIL